MPASRATVLRLVIRMPMPDLPAPIHVGIDDWPQRMTKGMGMAKDKVLKRHLFNVSAAAHYMLDEQNSLHLRAVKIYETQIAIFFGEKLNARQRKRKEFPNRWLAVSSDLLAAARVCSAIRLLEHICKTNHADETALSSLLEDPNAREVLSSILLNPVGLRKLATATRPRLLDIKLRNRRRRQRRYASLYDVSLRWRIEQKSKLSGGPSTALKLFKQKRGTHAHALIRKYYPSLGGKTRTYEIADRGHFLAVFVWMGSYMEENFLPRQVGSANFAQKILHDAQDICRLARIFGQYEFIKARLEGRSYRLLALDLKEAVPSIPVDFPPLADELLDAIFSKGDK